MHLLHFFMIVYIRVVTHIVRCISIKVQVNCFQEKSKLDVEENQLTRHRSRFPIPGIWDESNNTFLLFCYSDCYAVPNKLYFAEN